MLNGCVKYQMEAGKYPFPLFDAHMGVANATIRNSTLGRQGINAIGSVTFTVENCTIYSRNLINLRSDYGSMWQGEFFIRNCVFVPAGGSTTSASLIGGSYSGSMISATPVICRNGSPSKICVSTTPNIRRTTRGRPFLQNSIQN